MKKLISIMLVAIVLVIGITLAFQYIILHGEFKKWSHATMDEDYFKGKTMYLGYDFTWKGIGSPMIEKVEFIKKDGTILAKDEDGFRNHPYFMKSNSIGILDEESVLKDGLMEELFEIKGQKVDKDFRLVLAVEYNRTNH
ncbi:hypothetical protein [Mesobacillus subterraneus]|uniref:Uncharacterized protein n=1 Tax=Mesobacillus subterraneus TaxID=285983 RepID=A0A427TW17_9BACI|nr:hypothetical protein [Mesobacillus subterraneus]RSD28697.1 hypothetical protein EJA10_03740 [Mesobacillus subterraneus]